MNNIFSFNGRSRRTEWWIVSLIINVIGAILGNCGLDAYDSIGFCIFVIILCVLLYWVMLATNARRCHDLGHSGWWQLIPFYGLWLAFAKGDECNNEYGLNPYTMEI